MFKVVIFIVHNLYIMPTNAWVKNIFCMGCEMRRGNEEEDGEVEY